MKKPNILLISNLFPNFEQPERGIFTYHIARELKKKCTITVISPLPWSPRIPYLPKQWSIFSVIPIRAHFKEFEVYYPKYFMVPLIGDYFSYLSLYFSLSHFFRSKIFAEKIDLINVHWAYPDAVAVEKIARQFQIPVIVSLLGSDVNRDMHKPYFCRLIKKTLKNCAQVVTVSGELKKAVINHGIREDKISVINNGVDLDKFPIRDKIQCRSELGLKQGQYYIVFVGRLEPVKGVGTLLEAVNANREKLSRVKIILVGDGSLSQKLKQDCIKNNLHDIFIFAGHQRHDTISKWYGAADLFCLPSLNEGHPNVIMEAIASGRPVVASDVGAISEFVTDKVGALFQAGNSKSLGEALENVISKNWSPEQIRNLVVTMTWQDSAQKYLNVFENILTS